MTYFAVLDKDQIVACEDEAHARRIYDEHLAKGHPAVRSASIFEAPDEETLRKDMAGWKPVRFVCAGIPRNYYDSDEWKESRERTRQARLARGDWECMCGEFCESDMTFCPNCGAEAPYLPDDDEPVAAKNQEQP